MHNGMARLLVAAVILAALGACADEEPRVVPTVASPIDLGALATAPCDALSEVQTKDLGLPRQGGEIHSREEGRLACIWDDYRTQLKFVPYPDKAILREVYEHTPTDVAVFGPFESAGFPGVEVMERESGTCRVTVGLSESQGFQIIELVTNKRECDRAKHAAEHVLQNLRRS